MIITNLITAKVIIGVCLKAPSNDDTYLRSALYVVRSVLIVATTTASRQQ